MKEQERVTAETPSVTPDSGHARQPEQRTTTWDTPFEHRMSGADPRGDASGFSWSTDPSSIMPSLRSGFSLQRMPETTGSAEGEEKAMEEEPEQSVAGGPVLIIDDDQKPGPGQMTKEVFLAQLRASVCAAAEQMFKGTRYTVQGCPWIEHWFGYYETRSAAHVESSIRRYVPSVAHAGAAAAYIPAVTDRVRSAIGVWLTTGRLTGIPGQMPNGMSSPEQPKKQGGMILPMADEGGIQETMNPLAVREQLGRGISLGADVGSRMGSVFGQSFSDVRVHTDATAAELSRRMNARAFTVGNHVAFAPNQYRPGTPHGDGLIAHELAHVVQQRGAGGVESRSSYGALESDAERTTAGAMGRLWGNARGPVLPQVSSGLALQRCKEEQIDWNDLFMNSEDLVRPVPLDERTSFFEGDTVVYGLVSVTADGQIIGPVQATDVTWYISYYPKAPITPGEKPEHDYYSRTYDGQNFPVQLEGAGDYLIQAKFRAGQAFSRSQAVTLNVAENDDAHQKALADRSHNEAEDSKPVDYRTARAELQDRLTMQLYDVSPNVENTKRKQSNRPYIEHLGFRDYYVTSQVDSATGLPFIDKSVEPGGDYYEQKDAHGGQPFASYTIRNLPLGAICRWYVEFPPTTPLSAINDIESDMAGHLETVQGATRIVVNSGDKPFVQIPLKVPYSFRLVCERTDPAGSGERYFFRQIVHSPQQSVFAEKAAGSIKEIEDTRTQMKDAIPIHAVHVDASTRKSTPLKLFYGLSLHASSAITIVDLTPDVEVVRYSGESMIYALYDFRQRNRYPTGYISLINPETDQAITMPTSGESAAQRTAGALGTASTVLGGIGALLAVTPLDMLTPIFLVTAGGIAALKSSMELDDLLGTVNVTSEDVVVNIADIALSVYDACSGTGALEKMTTRAGRFLVALHGASTAAKYVYSTSKTLERISQVLASQDVIDPQERSRLLRDLMIELVFDGTITLLGLMADADSVRMGLNPEAEKTSLSKLIPEEAREDLGKDHDALHDATKKLGPGELQGMVNSGTLLNDEHEESLHRIEDADAPHPAEISGVERQFFSNGNEDPVTKKESSSKHHASKSRAKKSRRRVAHGKRRRKH